MIPKAERKDFFETLWTLLIVFSVLLIFFAWAVITAQKAHGAKINPLPKTKTIELSLAMQNELEAIVYPPRDAMANQMHDEGCLQPIGVVILTHDPVSVRIFITCQDKEGEEAKNGQKDMLLLPRSNSSGTKTRCVQEAWN